MIYAPLAVLFDWYDTLLNTQSYFNDSIMKKVLKKMQYSNTDFKCMSHTTRKEYLISLVGEKWQDANSLYESELEKSCVLDSSKLNDGAIKLLDFLSKNRIYLAIVSNKNGVVLRKEVENVGLTKYFRQIIGAGDTPANKPSPQPIFAALENSGIEVSEKVFLIGDSLSDVQSAQNAGCLPITYKNKNAGYNVLSFTNFDEIGKFISDLLEKKYE